MFHFGLEDGENQPGCVSVCIDSFNDHTLLLLRSFAYLHVFILHV